MPNDSDNYSSQNSIWIKFFLNCVDSKNNNSSLKIYRQIILYNKRIFIGDVLKEVGV